MKDQTEIWKSHPDIPGIEVSSLGRVRSIKGHYYKNCRDKDGYMRITFYMNGKRFNKKVHRLVAQAFISNSNNLPEINHKDCDKKNNNVDNLEWCTHQENIAYRDKLGHTARNNAPKSPLYAINLATLELFKFTSQSEASRVLMVNLGNLASVISGRYNQAGGFWFVNADKNATDVIKRKLHDIQEKVVVK